MIYKFIDFINEQDISNSLKNDKTNKEIEKLDDEITKQQLVLKKAYLEKLKRDRKKLKDDELNQNK
jgi:hypothetical protein